MRYRLKSDVSDQSEHLLMQDMSGNAIAEAISQHPLAACTEGEELVMFAGQALRNAPCITPLRYITGANPSRDRMKDSAGERMWSGSQAKAG